MTVMFRQTIYGPVLLDDTRPTASFSDRLAPGVGGYSIDTPTGIYIGVISADTPGNGDVGRYLDSLPRDRRVVVPNVLSDRLIGMLERRGFTSGTEWSMEFQERIDLWERLPAPQVAATPRISPLGTAHLSPGVSAREEET